MREKPDKKLDLKQWLNRRFRFIVMNDDSLLEEGSFRFRIWQILLGFMAVLLAFFGFFLILIYLTPLNKVITQWGGIENNVVFINLNKRILELEELVLEQDVYKQGIENMLNTVSVPQDENEANSSSSRKQKDQQTLENIVFVSPIDGMVSSKFDAENNHLGVDLTAPQNTPVKSILSGTIIQADWNPDTGNTIAIQHAYDLVSFYKHNDVLLKGVGNKVKAGESIAIIGNTGSLSSGPHLHLELWHKGVPVNPEKYIELP